MASLRKFPGSVYWYGCFTMPSGKRVQRSTKEIRRNKAQAKADQWEKLTKQRVKAKQAHKVIAEIYREVNGEDLPSSTTRSYLTEWVQRRKGEVAPATFLAYKHRAEHFIAFLGEAADASMSEITVQQVRKYRDSEAKRVSSATAHNALKTLRVFFESARRELVIAENPAQDVQKLIGNDDAGDSRRSYTVEELQKLIAAASAEWKSLILFGLYTGQRLADLARLTWANVDLSAEELQLKPAKTRRKNPRKMVRIPLCKPLLAHIETLPAGDDPQAPMHPRAFATVSRRGHASTLSRQFGELLASVGLVEEKDTKHEGKGKGRNSRRAVNDLVFHSLRHTAVSMMKNAGMSPAVVQDIIGHESAEISAHYTHIESDAKRKALDAMPDLRG